jgi:tRNA 2-selenouridine synthase
MPIHLSPEEFIDKHELERPLLLDSRSEKEFLHAHIPGAVNIPLLNNEHRHLVGLEYKNAGKEAAVELGFKLVGPMFHQFIEQTKKLTDKKEILLYCWRGGMRSSIMSWVLSMAGFQVSMLKGGYKAYRNLVLSQFNKPRQIIIVGGNTGCGKTEILKELEKKGEQVIDLEGHANHRGSAFGQLGMPVQPSNEMFENILAGYWRRLSQDKVVWLESESRTIGKIKIPDQIFNQLQKAPLVEVICSRENRMERISNEYCNHPYELLEECTMKIRKRLGNLKLQLAIDALKTGDKNTWLEILLEYYDENYTYSLQARQSTIKYQFEIKDKDNYSDIAQRLMELSGSLTKTAAA